VFYQLTNGLIENHCVIKNYNLSALLHDLVFGLALC
jgi:hypothetical protein